MTERAIPLPGILGDSNRQQQRRIARGHARCCRCGWYIQVGQLACFDDGKDAHRECSETRNRELAKAGLSLIVDRAEAIQQRDGLAVGFQRGTAKILTGHRS